jgi:hypothetical protein
LFEAVSLEVAVAHVAGTPCAVAHGVVAVWPIVAMLDSNGRTGAIPG